MTQLTGELDESKNLGESKQRTIEQQSAELGQLKAEVTLRDKHIDGLQTQLASKTQDFMNLEKYLNDEQKLKEQEISAYEQELESAKDELAKVKTKLAAEIDKLKVELSRMTDEKRQVKESFETYKATAEREKTSLLSELELVLSNVGKKLDEEIRLQNQLVDEKSKLERATANLEQAERSIVQLKQAHANEKARLSQESATLRTELDTVIQERQVALTEAENAKERLAELIEAKKSLEVESEMRKNLVGELTGTVENVKRQNCELIGELDTKRAELLELRGLLDMANQNSVQLNERLTDVEQQLGAKSANCDGLKCELARVEEAARLLEQTLDEERANSKGALDQLNIEKAQLIAQLDCRMSEFNCLLAEKTTLLG